ncbi:MAG: ELWxxDGT repeat protein [Myxococcota bacterium]
MKKALIIAIVLVPFFGCSEPCTDDVQLVSGFQVVNGGVDRMASLGDRVVLTVDSHLWASDGSFEGTTTLPCTHVQEDSWVTAGDRLYILCSEGLMSTDGTTAGTAPLTGAAGELTVFGGELWFRGGGASTNLELWRSDGTPQGTRQAVDLSASGSSDPRDLTVAGGRLFFTADDGEHGRELYSSDGTIEGTQMVVDLVPGKAPSNPYALTATTSRLFFLAGDGQLWSSNGTTDGTFMVAPAGLALDAELTGAGTQVFYAKDGTLFVTDGFSTPDEVGSYEVGHRASAGGYFYFIAPLYKGGSAIWRTDGRPENTAPVVNPRSALAEVTGLQVSGSSLLFWIVGESVMQLRSTDLNGASGRVVADLSTDSLGWDIGSAVVHGDTVWFARNGIERAELWKVVTSGDCVH